MINPLAATHIVLTSFEYMPRCNWLYLMYSALYMIVLYLTVGYTAQMLTFFCMTLPISIRTYL